MFPVPLYIGHLTVYFVDETTWKNIKTAASASKQASGSASTASASASASVPNGLIHIQNF